MPDQFRWPGGQLAARLAVRSGSPVREEVAVAAEDNVQEPAPPELSYRVRACGEVVVDLGGALDIVSADIMVSYVRDVIDRCPGPVVVDLTALAFCDARGLGALLRMAGYAEQAGCEFRLISPRSSLVKILRITGLDRRFLASRATCPAGFGLGRPMARGAMA
jgi:anti-anti-sigma factor